MRAGALTGSLCSSAKGVGVRPTKKKPPEGGFLFRKQKITSSRGLPVLQEQRALRGLQEHLREPERHQRPVQEREPERRREPERGPEPERVLSCHKRPERLQQR